MFNVESLQSKLHDIKKQVQDVGKKVEENKDDREFMLRYMKKETELLKKERELRKKERLLMKMTTQPSLGI